MYYEHLNKIIFDKLESIDSKSRTWISLVDITENIPSPGVTEAVKKSSSVFNFLANPTSIDISRNVVWLEQPTLGSKATMLSYAYTQGQEISLNDITLPLTDKNAQKHIDELQSLMVSPNSKNEFTKFKAPYLAIVYGRRILYPVVINSINIKETMWRDGLPVYVKLDIKLKQLPVPAPPNLKAITGRDPNEIRSRNTKDEIRRNERDSVLEVQKKDNPLWFLDMDILGKEAGKTGDSVKDTLGGKKINETKDNIDKTKRDWRKKWKSITGR